MKTSLRSFELWVLLAGCLVQSSTAQVSVIGELSQDRDAQPGTAYDGAVIVKNDGGTPAEVKIYQTDYLFSCQGTSTYGEPGTNPRSNAGWIRFSPSSVIIPPHATQPIAYTVTVPADAATRQLTGTFWSMLMIEGIAQGSPESSMPGKKGEMGIRQTLRYGVQIATTIAHTGTKSVRYLQVKLVAGKTGGRALQIDIEDNGTLGFRPGVYVELFDAKGSSVGKFPGTSYRLYPGTSVRETIDVGSIVPGSYKALVVVDAGGEDVFGAQYSLDF